MTTSTENGAMFFAPASRFPAGCGAWPQATVLGFWSLTVTGHGSNGCQDIVVPG